MLKSPIFAPSEVYEINLENRTWRDRLADFITGGALTDARTQADIAHLRAATLREAGERNWQGEYVILCEEMAERQRNHDADLRLIQQLMRDNDTLKAAQRAPSFRGDN
jgi:hypothetical protein